MTPTPAQPLVLPPISLSVQPLSLPPTAGLARIAGISLAPGLERSVPEKCQECGGRDIIEVWSEGNAVCRLCGLVVAERMLDFSSEWRNFADDDRSGGDPSRVGGPANPLFDNPNFTAIGDYASGRYSALYRTSRKTVSAKDRLMVRVISEIDTILERINLSSNIVAENSKFVFKQYYEAKIQEVSRVAATKPVIAASIYIACRSLNAKRTFRETCTLTGVPVKRIRASVREIERLVPHIKEADINNSSNNNNINNINRFIDEEIIIRFCGKLGLKKTAHHKEATKLARCLYYDACSNRTVTTIYATALYIIATLSKSYNNNSNSSNRCNSNSNKDKKKWGSGNKSAKAIMRNVSTVTGAAVSTIGDAYRSAYPALKSNNNENCPKGEEFKGFKAMPRPR